MFHLVLRLLVYREAGYAFIPFNTMLVAVTEPLTVSANPKGDRDPCETSKLLNSSSRKWGRCRSVRSRQVGNVAAVREAAKTILLEQDPPYHKKDGGLFPYPPSHTSTDGVLVA